MTRLEQLVAEAEVEWRTLGEICRCITSGGTPRSEVKAYYGGGIPWLRTQEVDWRDIHDTAIKITPEGLKHSGAKWIPENCVIVAMYGATAAKAAINRIPLTTNQACCNLEVDPRMAHHRYVFYWLSQEYPKLRALGEGSQSNLNARKVKSYPIPIPPLSVQAEIVRILDAFTASETELESALTRELSARRKQYAYYRDQLLTFGEDEVEWRTLGEVCDISRGVRVVRRQLQATGPYPVYQNALTPLGYQDRYNCSAGTVFVIAAGAAGQIGYSEVDFWAADDCFRFHCHEGLIGRFLYYWLLDRQVYLKLRVRKAAVPRLPRLALEEFLVPIPPLARQAEIVGVLDRLHALSHSLMDGLPAELRARRKQYEHYRERLLSFPGANSTHK